MTYGVENSCGWFRVHTLHKIKDLLIWELILLSGLLLLLAGPKKVIGKMVLGMCWESDGESGIDGDG
nr:hypothetical protein [Tanacetum cinerariifolium]